MFRRIETRVVNPLLGKKIELPSYATEGSAALDLRACIEETVILQPGGRTLVKTGIAVNMMDPGLVAIVASRSGLSLKHGVRVAQGVGVIDADFHGEIGVILANDGQEPYAIEPGERSPEQLIGALNSGFYVTEVFGQGVNMVTGEYSRGASGFWIENGELTYPVSEVTIASNLKTMFLGLVPANDLDREYGTAAPTLLIEGMTLAGS